MGLGHTFSQNLLQPYSKKVYLYDMGAFNHIVFSSDKHLLQTRSIFKQLPSAPISIGEKMPNTHISEQCFLQSTNTLHKSLMHFDNRKMQHHIQQHTFKSSGL